MPLQPPNQPAPAVASGKIRIWDFVNTQLYVDVSIDLLETLNNISNGSTSLENIKYSILEQLTMLRSSYTWYGNSYQALVNDISRIHLVHTKSSSIEDINNTFMGRYIFSTQNSGNAGWTPHVLNNMFSPGIIAGGTHNSFQSGDEFKLIYLNPANCRLDVSGYKDTCTNCPPGFNAYNGTYTLVDPISRVLENPSNVEGTDVNVNNSGIGWKLVNLPNNPWIYTNPTIKKLKWERFLSEGLYGWRKAEITWDSGRYILRQHEYYNDSSHRHVYTTIATSPAPAIVFPYNEDMISPSMLKWTPKNFSNGTGGYITVNSHYDPKIPAPLPKGVRLGGGLKINPLTKIKFNF